MYRSIVYVWALLAALATPGCGTKEPRADYTFENGADVQTLDPALMTGQPEHRIASAIFEGLTARSPTGTDIVPGVAKSWELSDDGMRYTFHLRDCVWSDGTPVTADDFLYSWKRALDPAMGAAYYAYQLFYIRGAEEFNSGKLKDFSRVGVRVLDERTIEVELKQPTPFFLYLTSFYTLFPVKRSCVEHYGDLWTRPGNIVSNGPYILKEWMPSVRIRLIKSPLYWDRDNVKLGVVDALPTENESTAFNMYASGEADWVDGAGIPLHLIDLLKTRPDFHTTTILVTYFYRFNVTRPPLSDVRVRKALNLAADKQRIVDKILRAGQLPATTLVPPGMPHYRGTDGPAYNPGEARRLLAEAGYPGGKGFPSVSILFNTSEAHKQIAIEMQAIWKENLGIHAELDNQEWGTYLNTESKLDYFISRAGWVADYPDPNTFLDMFITGGGNNRTGWGSGRYDELIAAAGRERNPQRRMEIFREAERILVVEEMPIMPIYFYVSINLYDANRIGGIYPNPLDEHPLKYIYIR
ncbi:MAG: peptide ABC transporter substrate-binding protein [Candidatus Aureabacteria bacterium]|nr:peptide ABC transporter substrate-binding protein [Candidatus Auribacterota bacterium]